MEREDYVDEVLVCRDCGAEFVFTAGEQAFYAEKGFDQKPGRCKSCRDARKAASGSRELYTTTCANCNGEARVPFVPKENQQVYCSECYSKMNGRSRREEKFYKSGV